MREELALTEFAADVRESLTQTPRQLPSRYLYDELGSALFEAICRLPWYRLTRSERRLLALHATELFQRVAPICTIVELGPGSGEKLRALLESAGTHLDDLDVHLVDVSSAALDLAARTVATLPGVRIALHQATYEAGLAQAVAAAGASCRRLVLFLGSNIGNFDAASGRALLAGIRAELKPGDTLLLGADLVKPERDLLLAYDDPLQVTAAFNRNLLVRINRELGGNFDVERFAHRAAWNAEESRVEMHLVARGRQRICIRDAQLAFEMDAGEHIWTESSYKYRADDIVRLLAAAGFRTVEQWSDPEDGFALTLGEAA